MIRLFVFVFVRFFITVIAIFFALTFLKKIIQFLKGRSRSSPSVPQQGNPPKAKEVYKDVKDAKFVELPGKQNEEKQDLNT